MGSDSSRPPSGSGCDQCSKSESQRCSMNVLAVVKEHERFVFLYDDESLAALLHTLGRFARDRSLDFTWYDAALLSVKARQMKQQADAER